jgi:hypothetical protein
MSSWLRSSKYIPNYTMMLLHTYDFTFSICNYGFIDLLSPCSPYNRFCGGQWMFKWPYFGPMALFELSLIMFGNRTLTSPWFLASLDIKKHCSRLGSDATYPNSSTAQQWPWMASLVAVAPTLLAIHDCVFTKLLTDYVQSSTILTVEIEFDHRYARGATKRLLKPFLSLVSERANCLKYPAIPAASISSSASHLIAITMVSPKWVPSKKEIVEFSGTCSTSSYERLSAI